MSITTWASTHYLLAGSTIIFGATTGTLIYIVIAACLLFSLVYPFYLVNRKDK